MSHPGLRNLKDILSANGICLGTYEVSDSEMGLYYRGDTQDESAR